MLSLTLDTKSIRVRILEAFLAKSEAPGPFVIELSEISVFDGTLNGWHQSCMFEALSSSCHENRKL